MAIALSTVVASTAATSSVDISVNVLAGDLVVVGRTRWLTNSSNINLTVNSTAVTMVRNSSFVVSGSTNATLAFGYSFPAGTGSLTVHSSDGTAPQSAAMVAAVYSGVASVASTAYSTGNSTIASVSPTTASGPAVHVAWGSFANTANSPLGISSGSGMTVRSTGVSTNSPTRWIESILEDSPGSNSTVSALHNDVNAAPWAIANIRLAAIPSAPRLPAVWQ